MNNIEKGKRNRWYAYLVNNLTFEEILQGTVTCMVALGAEPPAPQGAAEKIANSLQHAQGKTGPALSEGRSCSVVKSLSKSNAPVLPPNGPASPVR